MNLSWTAVEELAQTSDQSAVSRRFAARNSLWLRVLLIFFALYSLSQLAPSRRSSLSVLLVTASLALVATVMFAVWSPSVRGWTSRRISKVAASFICLEYVLLLLISRVWTGWCVALPMLMLGFRMTTTRLLLVHAFLLAGCVTMRFIGPPIRNVNTNVAFAIVVNAMSLFVNLYLSRRMRREVVDDLSERRSHAREQLRMRDELRYARELQLRMLPEAPPDLPWSDISGKSVQATEVGGDYYDYFLQGGGRLAIVCADVAGHGMAAGLVLSSLRTGFAMSRDSLHDPAAVLQRLHDVVVETNRRRMLVTVAVVLIDPIAWKATIASAGHPPVLLRRANGTVESIDLFAMPLGVRLPLVVPQRTLSVAPGDTFVLHTDGIYETRSLAGEDYGLERLENVIQEHGGGTAEELRDAILEDVEGFRGSQEVADDMTVVVCRLN